MRNQLCCLLLLLLMTGPTVAQETPGVLNNTFAKLERGGPLRIVVIGNSVTHGAPAGEDRTTSFYWTLLDFLQERYPQADIEMQTSIIFAIGPELQLFRMQEKVFDHQPDLVIAEFGAANGAWGPAGRAVTDPATEGYVRRLRERLPECDLILQLGLFKTMMAWHERGETPPTAAFLKSVGAHYGCLVVDAQQRLAEQIMAGTPWKQLMKDPIHPTPEGYAVHSAVLRENLERAHAAYRADPRPVAEHPLPEATLHATPWTRPRLAPAEAATEIKGFEPAEFGVFNGLSADQAGAQLSFRPERGRCVGLLVRRPRDMGKLQILHEGAWVDLGLAQEPTAIEESDPDRNVLARHFFHADGLPLAWDALRLRTRAGDGGEVGRVQVIGFFVVDDL